MTSWLDEYLDRHAPAKPLDLSAANDPAPPMTADAFAELELQYEDIVSGNSEPWLLCYSCRRPVAMGPHIGCRCSPPPARSPEPAA